ncbi:phosphohydrolase [Bacillaceae bacterium SIJ1]|uniref:metallophosphoesterase n=1 Tax=Litoribacterium kuwaitense TaxID=1398745 RepID=UPI0013EACD97|nr:metallophosphoesterase [Litoribacterium kuwaitense]NGP46662.1 phosphohydrolase [Litoribacterium kuwaitense]
MRLGVISDLHIDTNSDETWSSEDFKTILARELSEQKVELLLIAGDVSNHHKLSHAFVKSLKEISGIDILFIPGNHDYWDQENEHKATWEIYNDFKAQEESLLEKPYHINDEWVIVGHSGWYDYTYADSRFSTEHLQERTYNGRTWKDKLYTDWQMSDRELSKLFADKVQNDLEQVKDKKVILMTHMVTYQKFSVQMPHPVFDYFNAFIGTSHYIPFFQNYPVKYNIMGHVHHRESEEKDGIIHICSCLGNRKEWGSDDLHREIEDTLSIIDL